MRACTTLAIGAALICAVAFSAPAAAQAVQGRVTERPGGDPLEGAVVTLVGPDNSVVDSARTADDGSFLVAGRREGIHRVRVELVGYRPAVSNPLRLATTDTLDVDIALPLQLVLLDSVRVGSRARRRQAIYLREFYDRVESNPFGEYFTRADIERARPIQVTELFRQVAGMRVIQTYAGGNRLELRGCTPTVYVDGTRVFLGPQTIDDLVPPGDLEGIEVYKSLAGAPIRAQGLNAGCSAIFFWTRVEGGPR